MAARVGGAKEKGGGGVDASRDGGRDGGRSAGKRDTGPRDAGVGADAGWAPDGETCCDDAGEGEVTVRYGHDALTLPVQIPQKFSFPGLERHADWFRVQMFAESTGMNQDEFEAKINAGEIKPRLVIVTRNPHSETTKDGRFDLETSESWGWGEVRRDLWTFTFHEFLRDGGFSIETLRFPESGASFYRRQVKADLAGEPLPVRPDDELKEGSWQYQAALPLMNRRPGITTEQQGLRNAGWTLPAASASMIALMVFLAFALAPSREQIERRVQRAA